MGLLGAVKDKNNVYVINESMPIIGDKSKVCPTNLQTWVPENLKHTILACDNVEAKIEIIKKIKEPITLSEEEDGLSIDFLLKSLTPRIVDLYYDSGLVEGNKFDSLTTSLLIASKDKCFFLGAKGTVREIGDAEFFSNDGIFMLTALEEIGDLPLFEKLKIAIYKYNEYVSNVRFPVLVMDTLNLSQTFFSFGDCKEAYEKYMENK